MLGKFPIFMLILLLYVKIGKFSLMEDAHTGIIIMFGRLIALGRGVIGHRLSVYRYLRIRQNMIQTVMQKER